VSGRPCIASCLLAVLAHTASAQRVPSDSVVLTFDWPVGLEAAVSYLQVQVREQGGRSDTSASAIRFRMVVGRHPRGRSVTYSDFAVPGSAAVPDSAVLELVAAAALPGVVVGDSGELVGLADTARFAASVRALVQPIVDSLPPGDLGRRVREYLERVLDPAVLAARASGDWSALVGFWVGGRLERGTTMVFTTEEPIPLFPGRTVPYHYQFTYVGRASCEDGARDSACVELDLLTVPDSAAVRALIASMVMDVAGAAAAGAAVIRRLEVENHVRLVTEPRGLIPHVLEAAQQVVAEGSSPAEGDLVVTQSRLRRFVFTYTARRP